MTMVVIILGIIGLIAPLNIVRPSGTVYRVSPLQQYQREMNTFQQLKKVMMPIVTRMGVASGRLMAMFGSATLYQWSVRPVLLKKM
jgi:hypothetical protein